MRERERGGEFKKEMGFVGGVEAGAEGRWRRRAR